MGFLQPPAGSPRVPELDVGIVLVPALAVDERGHRIGWGKGFYDRLLPLVPDAVRIALVFDFQLVAEVPDTPGDERVDYVVTDSRVIATARVRSGG
jgi:5-formyltetrahydrofolate cyclo-ligase